MTKNDRQQLIGDITIETVSKSIYKETSTLGFSQKDYIKLANSLLDIALTHDHSGNGTEKKEYDYADQTVVLPVETDELIIRPLDPEIDLPAIHSWLEDKYGRYFILSRTTSRIGTIDELIENDCNHLGVVTSKDGDLIGLLGFLDHDAYHHKAEMRKLIGNPAYKGKGYARKATALWMSYGITTLGLKKIYINTVETHIANIKLNKELGFEVEGLFRKEVIIDDEYTDLLRMAYIVK